MNEDLLKKCEIFCHLQTEQLHDFCVDSFIKTYKAGDIVFHSHSEPEQLFVVQQGLIRLNLTSSDRHQALSGFIGKQTLGPSLEVILNKPTISQATAVIDTTILVLHKAHFLQHYNSDAALLNKLLSHHLEQSYFFLKIYEMAVSSNADVQIAATLISLYIVSVSDGSNISYSNVDFIALCTNNTEVELAYSQEQLAALCAVTRPTLVKVLNSWRDAGWIEMRSKKVLIKSIYGLVLQIAPEGENRTQWRGLDKQPQHPAIVGEKNAGHRKLNN